ncbi:MAG: glycosyltransferase family 4 protein [Phormidesmis sp.]
MNKKSIAIFDLSITADSPAGSCILQLIKNLAHEYKFIVFADRFENPDPKRVVWVRIPLPNRPVILRYIAFKYLAPLYYQRFIKRQQQKPDLVIATEGEFAKCDICYVHFCHRAYLKKQVFKLTSLRAIARFFNHQFNARAEAEATSQATTIVVPSSGLAHELFQTYGSALTGEIKTIPNPLDIQHFTKPAAYDTDNLRHQLGFTPKDIVLMFAALGDFERKGLNLILQSLSNLDIPQVKLLVVGGSDSEVSEYRDICKQLSISQQVNFLGFQSDIRPYLWLSDLFALPSAYETFSLVAYQAAIAGLPVMATQLHGVEEFLKPGINGWLIERSEDSITKTLQEVVKRQTDLKDMGIQAHATASQYDIPLFVQHWQRLLSALLKRDSKPAPTHSIAA